MADLSPPPARRPFVIPPLPRVVIRNSERNPNVESQNRMSSKFKILINANVSHKADEDKRMAVAIRLARTFDLVFGYTNDNISTFARPLSPLVRRNLHWLTPSNPIFPTPVFAARRGIEIGATRGLVHLHGIYKIIHYGQLHLDYSGLVAAIRQLLNPPDDDLELGITRPYIRIKYYPSDDGDEEYITKGEVLRTVDLPQMPPQPEEDNDDDLLDDLPNLNISETSAQGESRRAPPPPATYRIRTTRREREY